MGKATGFIEFKRTKPPARPIDERLRDWQEVYLLDPMQQIREQGARCMDCGIPFCHQGCPLGNLIPDWNDLVYRDHWQRGDRAAARDQQLPGVHRPALPGAVRRIVRARHQRRSGDDQAHRAGDRRARVRRRLDRAAAAVRAHREGGRGRRLRPRRARRGRSAEPRRPHGDGLRARRSHRRAAALRHPRVQDGEAPSRSPARAAWSRKASCSAPASTSASTCRSTALRRDFDAIVLCGGATAPRDLPVPGRELDGHPLRDGVPDAAEPPLRGRRRSPDDEIISARRQARRHHRRRRHRRRLPRHRRIARARVSVHQFELLPRPPDARAADNPWPQWPNIFRTSSAHEEGGERVYSVSTERFVGDGARPRHGARGGRGRDDARGRPHRVRAACRTREFELEGRPRAAGDGLRRARARTGCSSELGVRLTERGNVWRDERLDDERAGVFTAGDMQRGQSLIVWAIADGRNAARSVDKLLMGHSELP